MKLARVVGRVTLSVGDPAYKGARFLVASPWSPKAPEPPAGKLRKGNSFVVYDNLGASPGDLIGYTDGGEAAAPFPEPTPCDAYNVAIIDKLTHKPLPT
ncbi:MAG: ethanolamine utilization protein EutN [Opitutales bacterium]|nr:ethanolamine utilization protein EutN [Opitutales bacterium]